MKRLIMVSMIMCAVLLVGCTGKNKDKAVKTEKQTTKTAQTTTNPNEIKTIKLENGTEVTWFKDNSGNKLNPRELFPTVTDELWNSLGLSDGLPASVSTFLMKVDNEYILFDAGLGDVGGQTMRHLTKMNINAEQIKLIYLTHFHGDHIGGLITAGENGEVRKTFPNAQLYASKTEYDAWMNVIANNKLQKNIMEIYQPQLHLFDFEETLPHNVTAINAVGHTPGHTAFRYNELLIIGDLMHGYALQKDHPEINSIYDMDQEQSAQSRVRMLDYARDNALIIAGMHLPEPGFIQ